VSSNRPSRHRPYIYFPAAHGRDTDRGLGRELALSHDLAAAAGGNATNERRNDFDNRAVIARAITIAGVDYQRVSPIMRRRVADAPDNGRRDFEASDARAATEQSDAL
jgi:hypothetical protein